MDYDADEKSMAALRRQLRRARGEYYRYKRYVFCGSTKTLTLSTVILSLPFFDQELSFYSYIYFSQ